MKLVTAACVSGGNPEKLIRILDLTGLDKTEVIMRSWSIYDHATRNVGVKMITVTNAEDVGKAISLRAAMIYMMAGNPDLPKIAELAKPMDIQILVDAAADDLTVHLQQGATIVVYSGGKALCGPQCAGLALGRKDILLSTWQASSPHHGPGRDNKVGKEEMLGMLAAVEDWVTRDHVEKMNTWRGYFDTISKRILSIKGVTCTITEPRGLSNHSPRLLITWDPDTFYIDEPEVAEELATKSPRIAVSSRFMDQSGSTSISVNSGQMQPGNDKVVAERIYDILRQKRSKPKEMTPPTTNITGRWDVDIEFYSSKSQHTFYIEKQDGNWIEGAHKGDFSTRDMVGILEGNQVKLSSSHRPIADNVPNVFSGTVTGDTMSGEIFLGEYIRAKFNAKRHSQPSLRNPIRFPKGQPLVT